MPVKNSWVALVKCIAVLLAVYLLVSPFYFVLFRIVAFDTVPYDDYHSGILWLAGKNQDFAPWSPTCYRFGYFLSGYVFYELLPLFPLTNLPSAPHDTETLRALQGITLASYHYLLGFFLLVYHFAKSSLQATRTEAVALVAVTAPFVLHMDFYGIDSFYLFLSMVFLINLERKAFFTVSMLLAPLMIEKNPTFFCHLSCTVGGCTKQVAPILLATWFFLFGPFDILFHSSMASVSRI